MKKFNLELEDGRQYSVEGESLEKVWEGRKIPKVWQENLSLVKEQDITEDNDKKKQRKKEKEKSKNDLSTLEELPKGAKLPEVIATLNILIKASR